MVDDQKTSRLHRLRKDPADRLSEAFLLRLRPAEFQLTELAFNISTLKSKNTMFAGAVVDAAVAKIKKDGSPEDIAEMEALLASLKNATL